MVLFSRCDSPFGPIRIGCEGGNIVSLRLDECSEISAVHSPAAELASRQLQEYFAGSRRSFDLPVLLKGTPFQIAVWRELCKIPYGQVRTYGEIAAAIGKPKAARAVGMACNRNPLWIVVPCHRIVGSKGLTGYAGGLPMKQALLELEQQT